MTFKAPLLLRGTDFMCAVYFWAFLGRVEHTKLMSPKAAAGSLYFKSLVSGE